MTQFKEKPFIQLFDIIVKKERFVLDTEKDKYPNKEKICQYLNGTTGEISTELKDIVTDRKYYIMNFSAANREETGYSVEYDEEQKILVFHLLKRDNLKTIASGTKFEWMECTRFLIEKADDLYNFYTKKGGYSCCSRGYNSSLSIDYAKSLVNEYQLEYELPIPSNVFEGKIQRFVNILDGTETGFLKVISNMFPPIFNISGNNYLPLLNYPNMCEYLKAWKNGLTCGKKTGKKQDIIDKLISYPLKDIPVPCKEDINYKYVENDIFKFAIIEKVPIEDNDVCVVRTLNYVISENYLFEGGRIYVDKKTVNFCKKNNSGVYVAQPLLSKICHWDFYLNKFPETETKGTMLEYFGSIVQKLEPFNRSVAIWMFLKEPYLESLAKISSDNFIDEFISTLRDCENINTTYYYSLGITNTNSKKLFQVLGINKEQFAMVKDILPSCMPKSYFSSNSNNFCLSYGIIPICKCLLKGEYSADISDVDKKTFEEYLNFAMDLFSLYDMANSSRTYGNDHISDIINRICDEVNETKRVFPKFDIKNTFNIFTNLAEKSLTVMRNSYNRWNYIRYYTDYISMVDRLEDKDYYKPKFSSYEDLVNMHENVQLLIEYKNSKALEEKWTMRYQLWEKWIFQKDDKKLKDGTIKEKGLPFIVVYPKKPVELAIEGTRLHHCVKSYIERVSDGITNIVFIRKKDAPEEPFFTVEITNDNHIQQVHGFDNRNANTEEGLEDFLKIWAKAKHLKLDGYNKVR